jgi:uncharacterized protein YprB with RNaseH-like and TPR domain
MPRAADHPSGGTGREFVSRTVTLALGVEEGTLIDFETTGIPGKTPEHEVVTLGYLYANKLVVMQRRTPEKDPFYGELRKVIAHLPRPLFSYNAKFEREIIEVELGLRIREEDIVDIMEPWRKKAEAAGLKWPKLDELISEPEDYFGTDKITGRDVPRLWREYLATGASPVLTKIMEHSLSDILREAILLLRMTDRPSG